MKNIFFSGRKTKDTGRWWRGTNSIDFSSLLLPHGSLFVDGGREVAREGGQSLHRFRLSICSNQLAVKLQMRRGLDQDKIDNNNWHHSLDNLRTQKESIQFTGSLVTWVGKIYRPEPMKAAHTRGLGTRDPLTRGPEARGPRCAGPWRGQGDSAACGRIPLHLYHSDERLPTRQPWSQGQRGCIILCGLERLATDKCTRQINAAHAHLASATQTANGTTAG